MVGIAVKWIGPEPDFVLVGDAIAIAIDDPMG